jgi:hypothetical protein
VKTKNAWRPAGTVLALLAVPALALALLTPQSRRAPTGSTPLADASVVKIMTPRTMAHDQQQEAALLLSDWQYTGRDLTKGSYKHQKSGQTTAQAVAVAIAPAGNHASVVSIAVSKNSCAKAAVYASASVTACPQVQSPVQTGLVAFAFGYAAAGSH